MLWHHLFLDTAQYGQITQHVAVAAKVCVALFLFVSGYGLTKQFSRLSKKNLKSTAKFLLLRFTKFFMAYWICFVIVILLGTLCGYSLQDAYPSTRNTLKCLLLDAWGQMGYNSYLQPWWFNKMILQLYLLFPILYLLTWNKWSSLIGLAAFCLMQISVKTLPGNVFFIVEGGLPAFYLGIITSRHEFFPSSTKKSSRLYTSIAIFLILVTLFILHNHIVPFNAYLAILIRAFLAITIVSFYKSISLKENTVIHFIGKYATIMYLTHVLILIVIPDVVYFPNKSLLIFIFYLLLCLVFAIAIMWIEKVTRYDELKNALVCFINRI